jgi:hypothetical protein
VPVVPAEPVQPARRGIIKEVIEINFVIRMKGAPGNAKRNAPRESRGSFGPDAPPR